MTDKTDTGASAVGNVVAGKVTGGDHNVVARLRAASAGIGTSGAIEAAARLRSTINEVGTVTAPTKQTWRDWQVEDAIDPGELITREELIRQLVSEGVDVDANDITYWQSSGVIPYAERQWNGRTAFAFYPVWMVDVVRELRALQAQGRKLAELRPQLRTLAKALTARHRDVALADAETESVPVGTRFSVSEARAPMGKLTLDKLGILAIGMKMASMYEDEGGPHITRVDIRLIDERGLSHNFEIELEGAPDDQSSLESLDIQ